MKGYIQDYSHTGKIIIVDTGAILTGYIRGIYQQVYTTSKVVDEVKDYESRMILNMLDKASRIMIIDPDKKYLDRAESIASRSRVLNKLSETDLSILALAIMMIEEGYTVIVVTDDHALQKALKRIGAKIVSIRYKGIA